MKKHRYVIRFGIALLSLLLGFGCAPSKKQERAHLPCISFKKYLESNDKQ